VNGALIAIVIFAATISRPIEVHLWRAGRLSDRATAMLLVGRFPVVAFLFGLILGGSLPRTIGLTLLALLPAAFFYGMILSLLRDEAQRSRIRYHGVKG
jgi:ABC-type multidrug transport system permease subunit